MPLQVRSLPFEIPSYSLTGDILAYQRCALQYRYYNGSSLPPSRPVQMWTGEFVHQTMEEAYRRWRLQNPPFPWPCTVTPWPNDEPPVPSAEELARRPKHDIGCIGDLAEGHLRAAGKEPRSREARRFAYARVTAAINLLGPDLFPLVTTAEERISGTREMPTFHPLDNVHSRGDRYELTGIADVISSVSVVTNPQNRVVRLIEEATSGLSAPYDLVVDYKAARRPGTGSSFWLHHQWQVQTYAWLRSQTPQSIPVGAGIVVYVDELSPSKTDLVKLRAEMTNGTADVVPANGSADYYALHQWTPDSGVPLPQFSPEFLLRRAIRVVGITPQSLTEAVGHIDRVVSEIERSALSEHVTGNIPDCWATTGEEADCVACDFKHFCQSPWQRRRNPGPAMPPGAPG